MSLVLQLKLQTPSIELKVKAVDASGSVDTFTVGFKRYDVEETSVKFEKLELITGQITKENPATKELDGFITEEILYLKNVDLTVGDSETGTDTKLSVPDTRLAKPKPGLWETPEQCKDAIISLYLTSAPYRISIISAMSKAFLNNDYEAGKAKN